MSEFDWTQKGTDIYGEAAGDESGWSVSLSDDGTILAIGAIYNDGNGTSSGHVRVYEWNGSSWVQKGSDIDGEKAGDRSGYSVSLSSDGSILAIGAIYNSPSLQQAGHVRVYEWNGSAWIQKGSDIDGDLHYDRSGNSVSLSDDGTILAVGAIYHDGVGANAGHVKIYEWNGSAWIQKGSDLDGETGAGFFGYSVSFSSDGSILAVGAIYNNENGRKAGHVRVYEWNGSAWIQKGSDIDSEAGGDESGWSVSLSSDGSILAIGAVYNDGNGTSSGHVRVFEWNGSAWIQKGSDIDGEAAGDQSGYSVSLSNDGTILAIGAILNDGNGADSGHVRVFEWDGSAWVQKGSDIDGEAAGDKSGYSVSLSSNGYILAIGATLNDVNGSNSGHVRVFELPPPSPDDGEDPSPATETITNTGSDISVGGNIIVSSGGTVEGNVEQGFTNLSTITNWFSNNTPTYFNASGINISLTTGNTVYYATNIDPTSSFDITINGTTVTYNMETQFPSTYSFVDNNNNLIEIRPVFKGSGGLEVENLGSNNGIPCLTNTCYILTPEGYKNVSTLQVGDIVTTHDNRHIAIEKLFSSKVLASRVKPRLIRAHQYGENKPFRDTYLSDLHAYNIGGKWKIPKNECLPQEWNEREVTYYHIKLPNYRSDFLVVNGLITECWGGLIPKN
jgi:hypothetical protein